MKEIRALSLYWNTKCRSRIDMSFNDIVVCILRNTISSIKSFIFFRKILNLK